MSSSFLFEHQAKVETTTVATKTSGGPDDEKKNGSDER